MVKGDRGVVSQDDIEPLSHALGSHRFLLFD
jgi:hypothetical protein